MRHCNEAGQAGASDGKKCCSEMVVQRAALIARVSAAMLVMARNRVTAIRQAFSGCGVLVTGELVLKMGDDQRQYPRALGENIEPQQPPPEPPQVPPARLRIRFKSYF